MNKAPQLSPSSTTPAPPLEPAPVAPSQTSPTRPPLQRLPGSSCLPRNTNPHAPSPLHAPPLRCIEDEEAAASSLSDDGGPSVAGEEESSADGSGAESAAEEMASPSAPAKASPDEMEIERLRGLQLKVLQQQQRARVKPANTPSAAVGTRRVSPIKEEPPAAVISPTLEGAFSSPLPTGHTTSTESSSKTIRGSVTSMPPTPANHLRTPSYPFPTAPNTPRVWSSALHQPFTTLSPTSTAMHHRDATTPMEFISSETTTPAATNSPFVPAGTRNSPTLTDPRYPTPSLYDLVLQMSAEPGLVAWWHSVTAILVECYGMHRATLAVPADASDIENVPWGQKATFNITNRRDTWPAGVHRTDRRETREEAASPERQTPVENQPPPPTREPRPNLQSRHSFAGHEPPKGDEESGQPMAPASPARPQGPRRTASHMPQTGAREHPLRQVSPFQFDGSSRPAFTTPSRPHIVTPAGETTFSDPEFSSVGGDPAALDPPVAVFPVLRAIDHESDPLIDNTGVNRVLERGRLVTLTRDYSFSNDTPRKEPSPGKEEQQRQAQKQASTSGQEPSGPSSTRRGSGLGPRPGHAEHAELHARSRYEEYEQFPSSPWAQSPAPSPAIQTEENENPFFAASNVDEESFNPSPSAQDYTQYDLVEAIGIDKASTVTHIPFIHPTLSQPMHSAHPPSSAGSSSSGGEENGTPRAQSTTSEPERRAPIAILSFLSPIVPYPRNLTNSLKLLGPHLATTFFNACQYSHLMTQASGLRNRRFASGTTGGHYSDQDSLDDLLHLDLENMPSSAAGSMTSPSDYSGRSKYSPGGSIGGTPGWDPSNVGFPSKPSVGNTPGHLSATEAVESYFDAKKRSTRPGHPTPGPQETKTRRSVHRAHTYNEDDMTTPRNEKGVAQGSVHDDSTRKSRGTPQQHHHRSHSLLHSYGADFSASFQSLPAATTPGGKSQGAGRVVYGEPPEMPPPSENLLRTIIDSLPVQIFTALPITGALTWVNSKFLVYRGQDSRQVLQDPWDTIHPEDKHAYLDQWNQSLRTGQQLQRKLRLQRFDGHYRWFYVRVAPLKNKRQQIVHWIGTNMDVHDQHLAEINSARQQETAASEAKYRALANSSPQIVFVVSNTRGLTFCNSQWITYSGQTEAQAHGNGFLESVYSDDVPKCKLPELGEDGTFTANVPTSMPSESDRKDSSASEDSFSDADNAITSPGSISPGTLELPQAKLSQLATEGILRVTKDPSGRASYSTEVRLRNKDGEYRWHLVRVLLEKALADDSDEETWYGTATDINDHKLLEQTLKETMDAKTRFLSNMSHEIRTPLNGISGMVNFLLDSPLITEQLEHVNIIKASTDSLLNLINDILDLSKVEAGMIKLDMGWLHLPSLLEEVNDLNMGLAIQKGLELNYLVDEGVPSMVKGDKFRIRQVLLNVVGNAIKFTQKGEVFVRCRLAAPERQLAQDEDAAMVRFEVIDTGKGFTEEEAKYLFKRFSQIDGSSTRQHGGTGLGLAISMQFVELHGGKMDARSVPGKGSTFFFTIKFGLPTENDHPPLQAAALGTPSFEPVSLPSPSPSIAPSSAPTPMQKSLQSLAAAKVFAEKEPVYSPESAKSPVPSLASSEQSKYSPSLSMSSGSSDPSITAASLRTQSLRSDRSSASSFVQEFSAPKDDGMKLALPSKLSESQRAYSEASSMTSDETLKVPGDASPRLSPISSTSPPPMFSILVVCPLLHSQEATIRHIKNTLPQGIPHQVTGQSSLVEAQRMIGGNDPVIFTHIVLVLHEISEIIAIADQILSSSAYEKTSVVVVSDPTCKKELIHAAPQYDYDQLDSERRLQFVYRPLKPSKFAVIFDPQKERDLSNDRNQDTAQQVVVSQKLVFEELKKRLGNKGFKVLLVEDNKINQTVILKFLAKIQMETDTVLDGVQCTETVFSKPPGYYSIILCDLHMPNKDGYQACKEIRRWEKKHGHRRHPIIALSANVLGDVYAKCVEAGFNSYVTKPVEFKELSMVLAKFLDPPDPSKAPALMSKSRYPESAQRRS